MTENNTPKTRPLDNGKTLDSLFPARFLKVDHLASWNVTEVIVEIARVQEEEVAPRPGQNEWKPVFYFRNKTGQVHPQGYLLSARADKDALKTACDAETVGDLVGKKIKIKIDNWRGRPVLRIDPLPIKETS